MSLAAAYTNLGALLGGDANIRALLGTLNVIEGNREVSRIPANKLPALVLEVGKSNVEALVSGEQGGNDHEMQASFVWNETSESVAFGQRLSLLELVQKVLLSDATLGGAVDGAWVSGVQPDYGYNHPRQSMGFTISAAFLVSRG